jgi:predicted Zn finger-like uncharacterized protein
MKVACPHCRAAYNIDDRRVPEKGLNVRCPKCRQTFPVRKEVPPPADAGAIPLPAPAGGARVPPPHRSTVTASSDQTVPLPPPPRAPSPAAPAADFQLEPPGPLPVEDEPPPAAVAGDAAARAIDATPPRDAPPPELATPEPLPVPEEPLGFGEIDLASAPPAAASPPSSPEAAAPPSPPPPVPGSDGEELEMLFGEGAAGSAKPAPSSGAAPGYKVRRRSGKIFGPFAEAQIAEMLAKGELMGNEDVSADGGATWSPIGGFSVFGEVLRKVTAEPAAPSIAEPRRGVPFGDRMAAAKVVESSGLRGTARKLAVPAAALLLVLALGAGAGFTRFGFFFLKAFRRADAAKVVALLGEARASLDRAEYPADRAALDAAARAVAADPDSPEAAALHAMVVAALEIRHGSPAVALDQARRAADRLDADENGKVPALAARLAATLATSPGAATLPYETALEQASAKAQPDPEVVALLARAALGRADGPRAAALFARLEGMRPGTLRAAHGAGIALLAKRDLAGAKAAFAKLAGATPAHLPSRLELATIAEAAGELAEAEAQLGPLLAEGAEAKLAPAERARALALRGALIARASSRAAEADKIYEAAVQADPRLAEARLALARHRLQHADAPGAVAALEPLAAQAPAVPAIAAVRIRALAAAGRALDASTLADQALGRSPGDPGLLLAKAAALDAAGKGDDAARLYLDAAARDPGAFEPRLALGRIALGRKDLAQARLELAAAVERGPREPAAHAGLGELAAAEGDPAAAEKAFLAALALVGEYAPAEIGLAKLAIARGDVAAARGRLERALAIDPRNVEAYVVQGRLLWSAKDLAAAEKAFQTAVDLQPRNALALQGLGAVKLERGEDLDGAVQRLNAATNEDARYADARQWLGRALLRKGETPSAIAQLRKAVELEPHSPEHHLHLAIAIERSGALPEAVEEYRAAAAADPKFAEAHERLGVLFAANGRFQEAAAAYEKAIAAAPRVSRHRIALADCKDRLGKHEDAVRIYRQVMKADRAAVQVFYKLARALHESQGAHAALPFYERATREEQQNPMPHYYLGYLYKERGQKARALAEFKRFLALKPDADEKKDIEAEIEDLGGAAR